MKWFKKVLVSKSNCYNHSNGVCYDTTNMIFVYFISCSLYIWDIDQQVSCHNTPLGATRICETGLFITLLTPQANHRPESHSGGSLTAFGTKDYNEFRGVNSSSFTDLNGSGPFPIIMMVIWYQCVDRGPGVGVTKALFVNFSVSKIFDMAKV